MEPTDLAGPLELPRRDADFFRALIEHSRDAVVVCDDGGTITYQSPAVTDQLGYEADGCVGQHILDFVHPLDHPGVGRTLASSLAAPGVQRRIEVRLRPADGSWRWAEVRATCLLDQEAVRGIVLNTLVIHERKALELRNAAAKLDPHFLYNALNTIAAMIRSGDTSRAVEGVGRLRELTAGHLDASEWALAPLRMEWAWVRDYLALEKLRFGDDLSARVSRLPPGLGEVEIPPRIVQPLVENAIKHGVRARSGKGEVRVEATVEGGRLAIVVRERGDSHRIRRRSSRGGVGLRITRQRLHIHYGDSASLTLKVRPHTSVARLDLPLRGALG